MHKKFIGGLEKEKFKLILKFSQNGKNPRTQNGFGRITVDGDDMKMKKMSCSFQIQGLNYQYTTYFRRQFAQLDIHFTQNLSTFELLSPEQLCHADILLWMVTNIVYSIG
ncbi:hypothetical protein MTR_1g103280 [Medicago truncatula]|uniref:Uncharacterized protein n=1 Tax=Medicago truncatula TaxID=3880 RepID=A0A072VP98_MEDTR|nr:hypothetical protein MTR_1g103280 [Medicago truncatula]